MGCSYFLSIALFNRSNILRCNWFSLQLKAIRRNVSEEDPCSLLKVVSISKMNEQWKSSFALSEGEHQSKFLCLNVYVYYIVILLSRSLSCSDTDQKQWREQLQEKLLKRKYYPFTPSTNFCVK